MRKILTLNLDSLFGEYIYTNYNESGSGHEVVIDYNDKQAFLKELVDEFKERAKDLLELEYQCEGCENSFSDKDMTFECALCAAEICHQCGVKGYDEEDKETWTCDNCNC